MFIKTVLLFAYLSCASLPQDDSVTVYLVKQRWHTGIVIEVKEADTNYFPEITFFKEFKYIDAGWGDNEFFRHPDFDLGLAIKALFYPTTSAVRIEAFNIDILKYISYSDISYLIKMDRNSFNNLCGYISSTFRKKTDGKPELIEERYSGRIRFYFAEGKYSMFNTCNTWVAKGFRTAGFENDTRLVLAEELFDEIKEFKTSEKLK